MSSPTPDPAEQDELGRAPRVRLAILLALVRALSGARGHARVTWSGQGFVYTLAAVRARPHELDVDDDPTALNREAAQTALREALRDRWSL